MKALTKVEEASQVPWPHPDWADLNDWYLDYCPIGYRITRYLSNPYDCQLVTWHNAGRPVEGFESALWTKEEALGSN